MTRKDALKRKIATWLSVHGEASCSPPPVSIPALPRVQREYASSSPATTDALLSLPLFAEWRNSVSVMASLLTGMETDAAGELFGRIQQTLSAPTSEKLALQWFSAVHLLPQNLWSLAVEGFFQLAESLPEKTNSSGITDLSTSLASWFRVLRSCGDESITEEAVVFCLDLAGFWPGHFPYICDRLASGGNEVFEALKKAVDYQGVSEENKAVLMDFAADMGWLYPLTEFAPLWEIVATRGMPIYRRISEGMASMGSLRFFCGAMNALKKRRPIDELLSEERVHRAMVLFRSDDPATVAAVLKSSPVACNHIDSQMEIDLAIEMLSICPSGSENPNHLGEQFVEMVYMSQKGITYQGLVKFLSSMNGRVDGEALLFVCEYLVDTEGNSAYTAVDVLRMYHITEKVLSVGRMPDRRSLRTVFRALDGAPSGRRGLALMERAMTREGPHQTHLAAVASLLARAAPDEDAGFYISRTASIAGVFSLLTPVDRNKLSSGLAPTWMERFLDSEPEAEKIVFGFLGSVKDPSRRLRFLDMVVAPLMQEVGVSDPLFKDCLAFAVTGYNTAPEQDRLREAENLTLQRVFRAGGRVAALDTLMKDYLTLPGLDRHRSEELLSGIRAICDRFSRQAVWQEGFDRIFSSFLDRGIRDILNAYMEVPDALDRVDSSVIARLADTLMPARSTEASVSTEVGRSAMAFFADILPESIFFYHRQPEMLPGFLEKAIELSQRSIGGIPAGEEFLRHLGKDILQSRALEFSTSLEAWLQGRAIPTVETDNFKPDQILKSWTLTHEAREAPRRRIGGVAALLSSVHSRKEELIRICSILGSGLVSAGVPGAESLDYHCDRQGLIRLKGFLGEGRDPLDFFIALRKGKSLRGCGKAEAELRETIRSTGADPVYSWALKTLPPILNCSLMILLAESTDLDKALDTAEGIVEVLDFLGADSASEILLMIADCLSTAVFPGQASGLLEKHLFAPMWKTRALDRIELLLAGRKERRKLLELLLERLSLEGGTPEMVRFVRQFGNMFICVWGFILEKPFPNADRVLASALGQSWIFAGGSEAPPFPAALQDIHDRVRDEVRKQKHAFGVVSMEEAREISADMRRKYRDNADSVAILLRWTVDPSREDLLRLLEENEKLLQAVSTDQELLHLLDNYGNNSEVMEKAASLAGDPLELKKSLQALSPGSHGR
jgi:hypothetical protein